MSAVATSPASSANAGSTRSAAAGPKSSRFPELDGMRGFLAMCVLLIHTNLAPLYWLNVGMDCFFTMSAFVITLGLIRARAPSRLALLAMFVVRRSARIFPLYYLLIAGTALLLLAIQAMPAGLGLHRYPLSELLPYLFYAQFTDLYGTVGEDGIWESHLRFIDHTWSLAVEEQFYLLWGIAFALLPGARTRVALALAFVVTGIACRLGALLPSPLLPYRLDAFGYGILLAQGYDWIARGGDAQRLQPVARVSTAIFLGILALFLAAGDTFTELAAWWAGQRQWLVWKWTPISALSAAGCAALVALLAFGAGSRGLGWLRSPTMQYLGRLSYAIYLIHYPIVDVLLNLNTPILDYPFWLNTLLCVGLVVGLAHFATRLGTALNDRLVRRYGHSRIAPMPAPRG